MSQIGSGREPVTPTSLVWGDPVNDPTDQVGTMTFSDCVISEDHERTATVTEHSVEQGSNIVDHVRPNPRSLRLEVFVSNTPISSPDSDYAPLYLDLDPPGPTGFLAGGLANTIGLVNTLRNGLTTGYPTRIAAQVQQFEGYTDYVKNACDQLTQLLDSATLLHVVTPRQADYENMVIAGFTMHRDKDTGTSARFSIELKQIRLVQSSITTAPEPTIPRAAPAKPAAKKDTTPATGPKESNFVHEGKANGSLVGTHTTGIPVAP